MKTCDNWGMTDEDCHTCLQRFKDEVYQLFGLHPATKPELIYNDILAWREKDRLVCSCRIKTDKPCSVHGKQV